MKERYTRDGYIYLNVERFWAVSENNHRINSFLTLKNARDWIRTLV